MKTDPRLPNLLTLPKKIPAGSFEPAGLLMTAPAGQPAGSLGVPRKRMGRKGGLDELPGTLSGMRTADNTEKILRGFGASWVGLRRGIRKVGCRRPETDPQYFLIDIQFGRPKNGARRPRAVRSRSRMPCEGPWQAHRCTIRLSDEVWVVRSAGSVPAVPEGLRII